MVDMHRGVQSLLCLAKFCAQRHQAATSSTDLSLRARAAFLLRAGSVLTAVLLREGGRAELSAFSLYPDLHFIPW